jgi:hypothetical protein
MVNVPPFAFDYAREDFDDGDGGDDFDVEVDGDAGSGWAVASAQSATRMCSVSFAPQLLQTAAPHPSSSQHQEHPLLCSVSWRKPRGSRYVF